MPPAVLIRWMYAVPSSRSPSGPAVVGGDQLAVVVVEVCPRGDEPPLVNGFGCVARVDLHAGGVADQERLVALEHGDVAGHGGRRGSGVDRLGERKGRRDGDDPREEHARHVTASGWSGACATTRPCGRL